MPILVSENAIAVKMGHLDVGFKTGFLENCATKERVAAFKFAQFKEPQTKSWLDEPPQQDEFVENWVEPMVLFPANDSTALDTLISALQNFRLETYGQMLYTVGKKDQYDDYIKNDVNAAKAYGGSVWKDKEEALKHLDDGGTFKLYGVIANWETDTKETGSSWHSLTRSAKLVQL